MRRDGGGVLRPGLWRLAMSSVGGGVRALMSALRSPYYRPWWRKCRSCTCVTFKGELENERREEVRGAAGGSMKEERDVM